MCAGDAATQWPRQRGAARDASVASASRRGRGSLRACVPCEASSLPTLARYIVPALFHIWPNMPLMAPASVARRTRVRQRMGERRLLQLREAQHSALRLGITLAQFSPQVKTIGVLLSIPDCVGMAALGRG